MSNDIYDLLEINREENTSEAVTKPENIAQPIFIHLGILFGLIGLCCYLMKSKNVSNDEILIAFIFAILFLVFFVVLIVETIYYQVEKKFELRNAALFSILIFIASMVIILFSLGL